MNHYIDARGIDAARSWDMIIENISNKAGGGMTTITDSFEAAKYIKKMAENRGMETHMEEMGGDFYLHFGNDTRLQGPDRKAIPPKELVVVIAGDTLGRGDETLGKTLLKSYLYHLKYIKPLPKCLIFINKGVYLTTEGSDVLDDLRYLCENGVKILSSSTCLDYYKMKNKLLIGCEVAMREIGEKMNKGENTLVI